ncbi:MAG: SMI1/KNR4 family protein [Pseudomonadota bacterium]
MFNYWFPVLAFLLTGLAVYWVVFRDGSSTIPVNQSRDGTNIPASVSEADIVEIERELGVALPADYRAFLSSIRDASIDETEVLDSAEAIVDATKLYRSGLGRLPNWPAELVYIGDQADACPYALNCNSGEVARLDKGNIGHAPLDRYASFTDLIAYLRAAHSA